MGKTYVGEITKAEATQSPTVLANADLLNGVASLDVRDYRWTFQIVDSDGGTALLEARGAGGLFTEYRPGLVTGDIVETVTDEAYSEFRVTWAGTGGGGSVAVRGEERRR